ncbi:hypothetical protein EXN66_Car016357 [Channa argus]|uniref:Uncharacterized protein n=1 Tax=Channa argus TaxID=215402 RepID=A0A6G1QE39_CHAAH|nr:hypothetical protein EXN66_Car016357 [Channa argus]
MDTTCSPSLRHTQTHTNTHKEEEREQQTTIINTDHDPGHNMEYQSKLYSDRLPRFKVRLWRREVERLSTNLTVVGSIPGSSSHMSKCP